MTATLWKYRDFVIFAILLGVALAFPFFGVPRFIIAAVLIMYCYATVVSQWNLVFGLAGIFSLAQVAIFAFGAYSTALLGRYLEMNLWYSFPISGLGGILFSFLIGLACTDPAPLPREPNELPDDDLDVTWPERPEVDALVLEYSHLLLPDPLGSVRVGGDRHAGRLLRARGRPQNNLPLGRDAAHVVCDL